MRSHRHIKSDPQDTVSGKLSNRQIKMFAQIHIANHAQAFGLFGVLDEWCGVDTCENKQ